MHGGARIEQPYCGGGGMKVNIAFSYVIATSHEPYLCLFWSLVAHYGVRFARSCCSIVCVHHSTVAERSVITHSPVFQRHFKI
jgi:hypothetical protein